MHKGLDIAPLEDGVQGDPIRSVQDGVVEEIGYNKSNGYYIKVRHGNNFPFYTWYLHGKRKSIKVKPREKVRQGQVVMKMGNTGKVHGQTGVHLHFGLQIKEGDFVKYTDPMQAFNLAKGKYEDDKILVSRESGIVGPIIDAYHIFRRGLGMKPTQIELDRSFLTGEHYFQMGEFDKAERIYWELSKEGMHPKVRESAYLSLGRLYERKGDKMKAKNAYSDAINLHGIREEIIQERLDKLKK